MRWPRFSTTLMSESLKPSGRGAVFTDAAAVRM
jgi:hypothetical protein